MLRPTARFALLALVAACFPSGARAQEALAPEQGRQQPLEQPKPPPPQQVTPPQLLGEPVVADYPPQEAAQRRGARVVLELELDTEGLPASTKVLTPPQPGFDESALAAARRLRFTPARLGEKPIAVRIQYAFTFEPPPAPQPLPPSQQPVSLAGTVRERGTRRRLSGIEVLAPATNQSAVTDGKGYFELRGLPPGEVEIVIAASGYQRFSSTERLEEGKRVEVAYLVQGLFGSPYEATVTGERQRQEVSRTTLSIEETNRVPGAQGDALKVIEDLPGVARTSPIGGGLLVIRGSAPGDSLVFLDGLEIPLIYHFGALSSTVTPDLLEAIDYLPGNFSVQYGDMIGGLVQVRSRPLREEPHGYVNLNLLETSLLFEGAVPQIPGLRVSVSGRRSYIDFVLKAVVPSSSDFNLTVAPTYYDAQVRLDYRPPGSRHELQFLALTDDDKLSVLLKRPADQDPNISGNIDTNTGFSQIRLKHTYRDGAFTLQTAAMYEHILLGFDVGNENFNLTTNGVHLRSVASYEASDTLGFSAGVSLVQRHALVAAVFRQSLVVREGDPPPVTRPDEQYTVLHASPFDRFNPAVFAEARWKPLPGLTLTPGLRFDSYYYHPDQPSLTSTLSPRLAVRYELNDLLAFKGGVGEYTQGARNGDATSAFGSPAVLPERAIQATLGTEVRPIPGVFLSVEGFYKSLSDLIVRSGSTTLGDLLDNEGVGHIYGLEVLLRKELTQRLFGWIAYTFSASRRTDHPGDATRLFDFDQPHNLVLVGSYKLPEGWQFGGRLRVISGNPDTPVLGARYLAQSDTYAPFYGPVNSTRLPVFSQLDVRIDKVWTWDSWQLDAYLDVLNATNHRSIEGTQYSFDYSQSSYFKGLPVLPTLGMKGSF